MNELEYRQYQAKAPNKQNYVHYNGFNAKTGEATGIVSKEYLKELNLPIPNKIKDTRRQDEWVVLWSFDNDAYSQAMAEYHAQQRDLTNKLKEDLRNENNLTAKQGEKVYNLACQYGSSPLSIISYYEELAELFEE